MSFAVAVLLVVTHLHKDSFMVFDWPDGSISSKEEHPVRLIPEKPLST